jgi:ATP-dependent DNA helicase RecG
MTSSELLATWTAAGESDTLEFKRSTAELRRAGETLCGFLNGNGGRVLIGIAPDGSIVGQDVADSTLRDLAAMLGRFEPAVRIEMERVVLGNGREVVVLGAPSTREHAPFVFDGRPYKRVGSTTTVLPQQEYERLLLERNHSRYRWENQPAVGVVLEALDHEEILRTRETAIAQRRLSAGTPMDVGDILDRLGLRVAGQVTQAAQVLYGTRFLPYYPQCLLKLGRFRGTRITGDILDDKQEQMHAFAMVREASAWLDRTLPLAARFPKGSLFREDRLPVPAEALRETIVNAVIHRDLSQSASYVAIAVFDDRIEVRSVGSFPTGISAAMLAEPHPSVLRNPLIAGAFHRTGAVEVWGRGTNRVIEACRAHEIETPEYAESAGVVTVTFRVAVAQTQGSEELGHQAGTKLALSRHQAQVLEGARVSRSLQQLMVPSGRTDRTKFRDQVLAPLVQAGLLEPTVPDKPQSPRQEYRTTAAGLDLIGRKGAGS